MSKTEKILILENEIEARLIDELLKEKGIPHLVRSFHDSAYDGRLDAPEEYRDEILKIYEEMSLSEGMHHDEEAHPED